MYYWLAEACHQSKIYLQEVRMSEGKSPYTRINIVNPRGKLLEAAGRLERAGLTLTFAHRGTVKKGYPNAGDKMFVFVVVGYHVATMRSLYPGLAGEAVACGVCEAAWLYPGQLQTLQPDSSSPPAIGQWGDPPVV
jgi:hypothetical protein